MQRFFAVLFGILFTLAMITGIGFSGAESVAMDPAFYARQSAQLHCAADMGITQDQYNQLAAGIIGYLSGKQPELQVTIEVSGQEWNVYTPTELSHMADVRSIFLTGSLVRWIAFLLCAALLTIVLVKRDTSFRKRFAKTALLTLLIVFVLGVVAALLTWMDFTTMFTMFHKIFFRNNNWLLPVSSALIQMLPESFFSAAALSSVLRIIAGLGVLTVLLMFLWKKDHRLLLKKR